MQRSKVLSLSSGLLTALALLAPACDDGDDLPGVDDAEVLEAEDARPLDPPAADPARYFNGIDADFAAAADEFDVPVQLLQSIGYVETQWQMIAGQVEFEGQEAAFGVMALRGDRLRKGADLAGETVESVKTDRLANIRAAAALLSADADEQGLDRRELGAWAPVVARFSGIEQPEIQANYVHNDVYARLRAGVEVQGLSGAPVATLEPVDVVPQFADAINPTASADYGPAIWRASPHFNARPTGVKMVIIHSCEGAYSGCWGWLVNSQSKVSAHYVVKEDGSEISQLVRESDRAWHIGASYKCSLNSSKECQLDGSSSNNFTVGIEHAGFAAQASWNSNLINNSAKLVCDITKAHNIPRDKYHIVAHGQLQPYDRVDPGPNWPWTDYLSKINAHCGAVPPVDPPPAGTSIIIDSNNARNNTAVAKMTPPSANWVSATSSPGYWETGYFYANTAAVSDGVEFTFYLDAPATKTIDAWWTAGTNRSSATPFVAFNASGTNLATFNANQTVNGGKWVQLGTASFTKGWNKVVVSRWAAAGKVVIADAVRIR